MVLQFASYVCGATFYPAQHTSDSEVPIIKIPRSDGGVALTGTLQPKQFKLRGGFIANQAGITDVRTALDALTAAFASGPANLYFDSDRYWRRVQKVGMSTSYQGSWYPVIADVELDLITPDPFQYSTTPAGDIWNTPAGAHTITNSNGNAYAWPKFTFNLSAAAAIDITLENTTTGEAFTYSGSDVAAVVVVDCDAQTVTDGAGNSFIGLFDGVFPRLMPGANAFTLTLNGTQAATINDIDTTWTPRFY